MLSASKDHSVRMWNIQSTVCVAIFGGAEGHLDQVLSIDFDINGTRFVSSGMDNSIKIWRLNKPHIQFAILQSENYNTAAMRRQFDTVIEHFPDFSTRDIHGNYVDHIKWYGNVIISKVRVRIRLHDVFSCISSN